MEASPIRDSRALPVQILVAALRPNRPALRAGRALVKPAKTWGAEQAIPQRAARPEKTRRVAAAPRAEV